MCKETVIWQTAILRRVNMFHFRFSYVGLLYLLMLFIPNMIWAKHQPKGYEEYVKNENKILQTLERIGEVLVSCLVLIFSDFNVRFDSVWSIWLLASFVLMLLYEVYWVRYFRSEKTMADFYSSICKVPVAGATLPVCAFFLLGLYGCNAFLMIATVILGIGHIGIHLGHYKEVVGECKKKSVPIRVIKGMCALIATLVIAFAIVMVGSRNLHYIDSFVDTKRGVNEGVYVTLGGQKQYLLIQGDDVTNPVIIWLHGGPSSPDTFVNYIFQKYLADKYTVINWDQRGCGRTYFANSKVDADNKTVSFTQAQADLDELVSYACERFNAERVIIVGHSYGTMLGSQYVLNHPEKISAYIGVGQVVTIDSEVYSYEDALTRAKAQGDNTGEMEAAYETYIADKSLVNMMNLRKLTTPYHVAEKSANTIWEGITSPYMGVDDAKWFLKQAGDFEKYVALNKQLFDYIMVADVRNYGLNYEVPVGFITGSQDWTTPGKYAGEYCELITAPKKQFVQVEGCGHSPQYDDPEEFCEILLNMLNAYSE